MKNFTIVYKKKGYILSEVKGQRLPKKTAD